MIFIISSEKNHNSRARGGPPKENFNKNMNSFIKKPSAWIPIALTAVMLGMMFLYFMQFIPPEPTNDEGIMAHSFQLWAVLEFFAIIFFVFKWFPPKPRMAWKITALQIVLAIVPLTIVWFLEH